MRLRDLGKQASPLSLSTVISQTALRVYNALEGKSSNPKRAPFLTLYRNTSARHKERARVTHLTRARAFELIVMSYASRISFECKSAYNQRFFEKTRENDNTMSHLPNHSYYGQYYFNPQWVETAGGSTPSVVYNNVVNFTVGPDGTHYFHQTYSGQFVAPSGPTVDMKNVR